MEESDLIRSPQPLHGMFNKVPPRYDLINHIITLGQDKRWRKAAAKVCLEGNPEQLLDLGCGTGDLTIEIALQAKSTPEITGLDYAQPMLAIARAKAEKKGVKDKVTFIHGDATKIPYSDGYFGCVGISFAFRNLTYLNPHWEVHLAEVYRVLKSGGRFVIVESSQPHNAFIRACDHLYLRVFVRPAGAILSHEGPAYKYLAESAVHYYNPEQVREMLLRTGFREVSYRPLLLGAAGIHIATK
ncbi:MAG TPA: ubiquinone/menaquinone biosynthesis methyltransferase [Dehalococcoidales bacterium]|nr:ubiquinone/menaquinone biosynthesis methyltransferase [Dehalococcoidales bacterium]